jgi:hypothetical protein
MAQHKNFVSSNGKTEERLQWHARLHSSNSMGGTRIVEYPCR